MLFMNPIFWVAASALAGPALLHLLLRNRPKRRVLPTLRFLPVTSQQTMAMHRLKNILLLILRLLILLLIVAAFTRPYLKRRGTARENAETVDEGAVFAVDTSLSMRVGNRWRVAVNRAGTLMQTLPPDGLKALMLFDRSPRLACPPTKDAAAVDSALQAATPGCASTDLLAAIRASADVASRLNARRRRVYVIGDFQESGFKQLTLELALPEGVELAPIPVDDSSPWNAAVVAGSELADGKPGVRRVRVQLAGYGVGTGAGDLRICQGTKQIASRKVSLEHGERVVEDFSLNLKQEEDVLLRAELDLNDSVKEDNTLSFLLQGQGALPLLVCAPTSDVSLGRGGSGEADVGEAPAGVNPYLRALIESFGTRVKAAWIDPSRLAALSTAERKVALVHCPEGTSPQARQRLKQLAESGGAVILFPGGDAAFAEKDLEELCGARIEGWETLDRHRLVSSSAADSPFTLLDDTGSALLGHPKALRYLKVALPTDPKTVTPLVRFDDGLPFLIERRLGEGVVYLFTVPLDPKASDFVLRAAFSPFLYQLIQHCSDATREKRSFLVGDVLPDSAIPAGGRALLIDPDDRTIDLSAKRAPFAAPGVYRLKRDDGESALCVRIDPEESDLALMDPQRTSLLAQSGQGGGNASVQDPALAAFLHAAPEPDAPWRLWRYLLAAALACMAIETLLAARSSR